MQGHVMEDRSDSEEEGLEEQNWDDWEVDDDDDDDDDDELADKGSFADELLCLFCESKYTSSGLLFQHCNSAHHFDFYEIKKAYNMDFYGCVKFINYVRSQVSENKCWHCATGFHSAEELGNHLHEKKCSLEGNTVPWDDEKFLTPFLQDDALLYDFDDCDECEDDDVMPLSSQELAMHMSEVEQIRLDGEGSSNGYTDEIVNPCESGSKESDFTFDNGTEAEKCVGTSMVNGSNNSSDGTLAFANKKYSVFSSSRSSENDIKNIDKNYFGSYASFGIHRDMISDKVRTDAYKQAILENPSLLKGAVVMDVGCGTGILSLFAAQAGASRVIAVEASEMALVATQIAKDNGLLRDGCKNGVIEVVHSMVEELGNTDNIKPHSVDVLMSEWMGYCLLYESMLSSVLIARDRWLKPGGAILPDTATLFVAGFGRGGTSIPFWENVYGFNMSYIGQKVVEDAARIPIVDVVDSCHIVTTTNTLQSFDLATVQPKQLDFTAIVELEPKLDVSSNDSVTWCHGVVLWFDTGFTQRFCSENPVNLSTSPYGPSTHWSQTILTFRDPIAIAVNASDAKLATVGSKDCPAVKIQCRISVVRAALHRCIDISLELTGIGGSDGRKHSCPAQIFNLK